MNALSQNLAASCGLVLSIAAGLAEAGPVAGPKSQGDVVAAYSERIYVEPFVGGETAVIELAGDGDTDLDLYVYDNFGNLIVYDEGPTDHCRVAFTPFWTGPFVVQVVNRGAVYNRYTIWAQ